MSSKINCPSKLKVVKLMYFIDKFHLIKYGRHVLCLDYKRLELGPVPSQALEIINDPHALLRRDDLKYLEEHIEFADNKYRTIRPKKEPDLKELSKSEIKVINKVLNKYGKMSARELINVSHKEKAWLNAPWYSQLDIADIIDSLEDDDKKHIIDALQEDNRVSRELNLLLA